MISKKAVCVSMLFAVLILGGDSVASRRRPVTGIEQNNEQAQHLFEEALTSLAARESRATREKSIQAMSIWLGNNDPEAAGIAALQLGDLCRRADMVNDAIFYYKKVVATLSVSPSTRARAYKQLGDIYRRFYQKELASHNYHHAISLAHSGHDGSTESESLIALAVMEHEEGKNAAARDHANRAQASVGLGENDEARSRSLLVLGQIALDERRNDEADKALGEALSLLQTIGDEAGESRVLCSISALHRSLAQNQQALIEAEKAKDIANHLFGRTKLGFEKLRVREIRWGAWLAIARAQRALGNTGGARSAYLHAISDIEAIWLLRYSRMDYASVGFREEIQSAYRELVDLSVDQGQFERAFQEAQAAKARTLSAQIEARRASSLAPTGNHKERIDALSKSVARLRLKLLARIGRGDRARIEDELNLTEAMIEDERLSSDLQQGALGPIWPGPTSVARLQQSVLRQNEAVLEFFLGEKRSFAWLVSNDNMSFEILPSRGEIASAVSTYLELIGQPPSSLHHEWELEKQRISAEDLHSYLLGRLADRLGSAQQLTVVADGVLRWLPFESLMHGGHYLIEDHQISYLPSANMLESLRQPPHTSPSTDERMDLLAFGAPIFNPGLRRPSVGGRRRRRLADIQRQAWTSEGFHLSPLPGTREEVEAISSLIPKGKVRIYLGKDSTEKAFKSEVLRKYRWIHLATHSLIDEQNPDRSAVVLTQNGDPDEDGFLLATEIVELSLDCDLVVLSACETGRGLLLSGEGILGLSRAFLIAGARSVVVSQWAVDDISTALLMKDFYQQLVNNASASAALREAKLRMLHGRTERRHPYYWAPFIIIGVR